VSDALKKYAVATHPVHGKIWAFEVGGFGNSIFMDDANVPSLLALPYLGAYAINDPLYLATRRILLSPENPWYCKGNAAEGIGGPHAGINTIWPMSIVTRAFTSNSEKEIRSCLRMLVATHSGTGFIHEAFNKDDPTRYTRSWFAWSNTFLGELVLHLYNTRPSLLKEI
jgi:meiotically up-regulated gene 157 (Mug157) protein